MTHVLSRRAFVASTAAVAAGAALTRPARADADLSRVVRVAIHPTVGLARVGNSPDAFFLAPEVPGEVPRSPVKDERGAMARQGARFRVYGYDADGAVVAELTPDIARVDWRVHVANSKAAWYSIDQPFDIPDSPPVGLRNPSVPDRRSLIVEASPRRISGAARGPLPLDGGSFGGTPVRLGEVLTDARGRLVVLAGTGQAHALPGAEPLGGFADNDGWTDTTCDGPVHATVRIGGRTLEADPAWVVCASPNYAPGMPAGLVTLYDSIVSGLVESGRLRASRTDFSRDVWPILERTVDMQWVNAGYLQSNGFGSLQDWTEPRWRERLADPSPANRRFRTLLAANFRDPAYEDVRPTLQPQIYGEAVTAPTNLVEPRQWWAVTPTQYRHLRQWARGDFTDEPGARPASFAEVPLADQPATLDRASLDACLGGPYHPGVEFPWIARVPWLWTDDLRLRQGSDAPDAGDWGPELTAATALSRRGPLSRLGPGGVTQWMGVPWHADSASCRVGYQKAISLILPGFWPARIPNHVLSEGDYRIVMDQDRSLAERRQAFHRRREWERFIAQPTRPPTLALMVQEWFRQGVVIDRPGPGDGHFPDRMKVESLVGYDREPDQQYGAWMWVPQLPMFPLVVTNSGDNLLRSVDADGSVTVLPTQGPLARPEGIGRDSAGNLYVCAFDAGQLLQVSPQGVVTILASGLQAPVAVTLDSAGNAYVAVYQPAGWIAMVTPDGVTSVLVPPGAGLSQPIGLVVSPDGALLVSCAGTNTVARIDLASGDVLDPAWISGLNGPRGLVFDQRFHLFVAQRWSNTVTRYDLDGTPLPLTLRGAALGEPFGVAVDAEDRVYVSNSARNVVNRIVVTRGRGTVTDVATGMSDPGGIVFNG